MFSMGSSDFLLLLLYRLLSSPQSNQLFLPGCFLSPSHSHPSLLPFSLTRTYCLIFSSLPSALLAVQMFFFSFLASRFFVLAAFPSHSNSISQILSHPHHEKHSSLF